MIIFKRYSDGCGDLYKDDQYIGHIDGKLHDDDSERICMTGAFVALWKGDVKIEDHRRREND